MKKYIFTIILLVLFIPIIVKAETCDDDKVVISSISIENKSDNIEELDKAIANGKNIILNLSMSDIGDNIEYKIIVKNESNEDYELDKRSLSISSDYIEYTLELEDDSSIIKANSSKVIYLKVKYANEVPGEAFEFGTYNDNKTMTINMFTRDTKTSKDTKNNQDIKTAQAKKIFSNIIKNPNTAVQSYIQILLAIIPINVTIYIVLKKKKYTKFMILIIGISIIIPISVCALCKCGIEISTSIIIEKEEVFYTHELPISPNQYYAYEVGQHIDYYKYFLHSIRYGYNGPTEVFDTLNDCKNSISNFSNRYFLTEEELRCDIDFFGANSDLAYNSEELIKNRMEGFFIRHTVKKNTITKSDIGFVKDDNVYYLHGGNNKELFNNNLMLIKRLYGDICEKSHNQYYNTEMYHCTDGDYHIDMDELNNISYSYRYVFTCSIDYDGKSRCDNSF